MFSILTVRSIFVRYAPCQHSEVEAGDSTQPKSLTPIFTCKNFLQMPRTAVNGIVFLARLIFSVLTSESSASDYIGILTVKLQGVPGEAGEHKELGIRTTRERSI